MKWFKKKQPTPEQIKERLSRLPTSDLFLFVESSLMDTGQLFSATRNLSGDAASAYLDQSLSHVESIKYGLEEMINRTSDRDNLRNP
jgi:hypothetical protein